MANDHYAVCEEKKEYIYLGEFYEWDVKSLEVLKSRFGEPRDSSTWAYRFDYQGPGIWYICKLLLFFKKHHGTLVKVLHESDFCDLVYQKGAPKWTEVFN